MEIKKTPILNSNKEHCVVCEYTVELQYQLTMKGTTDIDIIYKSTKVDVLTYLIR
jgi:hypothetical protein